MSQEELPDATIEELTACGLRLKTPPATTFKAFGIDLVDKLFNVSSLTYAQVVKKTLPSGACLFTTCGRASGLKETQYASSVTVPNCFVDEHLSRLKELWIFDDTVLALTTQEKNAVKDLRLHKIHFEICISDLGKQRMVHRLPTEATPRPPPESRLIFSVTWNNTTNKPEYSFTRDDAQFEESGIIENGSVKFFLPRDAVWIKSRSETAHYFLTQAEWRDYAPTLAGKRRTPPPREEDGTQEPATKKARFDTARLEAARAALERAMDAPPTETPVGLDTFTDMARSDIPQRFTQELALMKNATTLRRGLNHGYEGLLRPARTATTWAECVAALVHHAHDRTALRDAWDDMEAALAVYSPTPVIDMVARWVEPKHMQAFEAYLHHADTGPLCSACDGPRVPRLACCAACKENGRCGFCRAHTSDDKAFAVMEGGCSRSHHPPPNTDE